MISFKGYLGNYHGSWVVDDHGSLFFVLSEPIYIDGRWDKGWYMGTVDHLCQSAQEVGNEDRVGNGSGDR